MKDEYVRKQDVVDMFNCAVQDVGILDADDIETVFGMLSSVDVAPVVHAHWKDNKNGTVSCSRCSTWFQKERVPYLYFCGYCGAKMD